MELPDWIRVVLAAYEANTAPFNEVQIADSLGSARKAQGDLTGSDWAAFLAEWSAFLFIERRDRDSIWNTYFAPMMTATRDDGTEVCSPDIKQLSAETIAHWELRARAVAVPVMKARYADLVWDLSVAIAGQKPRPEYARLAIAAYIEAADKKLYTIEIEGVQWLQRAFDLSLNLKDVALRQQVVESLFVLHDQIASPQHIGTWVFLFDTLYPHRKYLTPQQTQRIIDNLESMLTTTSDRNTPGRFDPWGAQAASERLATHYASQGRQTEVQRVVSFAGRAFESISEKADPLLAAVWLQPVIERYGQVGLSADAERVQRTAADKGKDIAASMKTIEVSVPIDLEELQRLIAYLTADDLQSSLLRIGQHFIPDVTQARAVLESTKRAAPLVSMIQVVHFDGGRPSARAGSVEDDPDGRLNMQLAEIITFGQPFLACALERLYELYTPTPDAIMDVLFESPFFANARQGLLQDGLAAYQAGDNVKAIHVLIPQIEHAMRNVLSALQIPTTKPVRGQPGIMDMKNMNDVLKDERVRAALPENLWRYLYVFYIDRRGINLRNNVAHGLVGLDGFSRPIANRVLHSVLAFSTMRMECDASAR